MKGKVVGHHIHIYTAVFQAIIKEQTTSEPYCGDR